MFQGTTRLSLSFLTKWLSLSVTADRLTYYVAMSENPSITFGRFFKVGLINLFCSRLFVKHLSDRSRNSASDIFVRNGESMSQTNCSKWPLPASFFLFFVLSTVYSKWAIPGHFFLYFWSFQQLTKNLLIIKFWGCLDSNYGSFILEATALTNDPQPQAPLLTKSINKF